jgi:hypothetical protein
VAPSTPIPPLCAVDARGSLDANLGPPGVHDQHRSAGIRVTTCLGGKKQGKYYASLQRQIRTCRWSDAGGGVARGVRAWGRFFSFLFFLVSFYFLFIFIYLLFLFSCLFSLFISIFPFSFYFSSCFYFLFIFPYFFNFIFLFYYISFIFLISLLFLFSFYLFFTFYCIFLFLFLYSFLFNIFSPLIFLLFEIRCKFVLARIISCSGYKCLVRVVITICSDPCSDTTFVFVRDDT